MLVSEINLSIEGLDILVLVVSNGSKVSEVQCIAV